MDLYLRLSGFVFFVLLFVKIFMYKMKIRDTMEVLLRQFFQKIFQTLGF